MNNVQYYKQLEQITPANIESYFKDVGEFNAFNAQVLQDAQRSYTRDKYLNQHILDDYKKAYQKLISKQPII